MEVNSAAYFGIFDVVRLDTVWLDKAWTTPHSTVTATGLVVFCPLRPTMSRLDSAPANGGSNRRRHRPGKIGNYRFSTPSSSSLRPP
jgi:hypothetical protein